LLFSSRSPCRDAMRRSLFSLTLVFASITASFLVMRFVFCVDSQGSPPGFNRILSVPLEIPSRNEGNLLLPTLRFLCTSTGPAGFIGMLQLHCPFFSFSRHQ